jgi:hypothetical protein
VCWAVRDELLLYVSISKLTPTLGNDVFAMGISVLSTLRTTTLHLAPDLEYGIAPIHECHYESEPKDASVTRTSIWSHPTSLRARAAS